MRKSVGYLALRRQQRPEPAEARSNEVDIGGDEAVEKIARALAADLDHTPVGKKRCFHVKISCDMLARNVSRRGINDKACATPII